MALNVARVKQLPVVRFNHAMEATTHTHFALLADLKLAVTQNELELYYQRKRSMSGDAKECVGLKALLRWNYPQRGLIMPDAFIGIPEQTGAVREVTRYVVAEAVNQLRFWSDDGLTLPIAVNISARALQDDSFPRFVAEKLTESAVDASLIAASSPT